MKRELWFRELACIPLTVLVALAVALGMHVFVYPSNFAPAGVDGVATMLQELTGINAGFFGLAINLPLLLTALLVLKKRYVLYTLLYTACHSFFLWLLARLLFYQYTPVGEGLLAAVFGGVAQGVTGVMLRIGASSGGVDVMACLVRRLLSRGAVERIISLLSLAVVITSFFVYGDLHSVLLSVVEIYVCERVTAFFLRMGSTQLDCSEVK